MARKPDYKLKVFNKVTKQKGTVGVAWKDVDADSFTIRLEPFVRLESGPDWVFELFSVLTEPDEAGDSVTKTTQEDIPF